MGSTLFDGAGAGGARRFEPFEAAEILALAFDHSPLAMSLVDVGPGAGRSELRRSFFVNRAMGDMLGYTVEELLEAEDQRRFTHPDDLAVDEASVAELLRGSGSVAEWDKRYLHADGHVVWGRVSLSILRNPDGTPRFLVAQIADITVRKALEQQLQDLADRDSLTGLYTRRAFLQAAEEELARCRRNGGGSALVALDVDHLKEINDTHGHVAGDTALVAVADAIRGRFAAVDVAARIGGDEFVVLLADSGLEQARAVAAAIALSVEKAIVRSPTGAPISVHASAGVVEFTAATPNVVAALHDADGEMYAAKRSDRA